MNLNYFIIQVHSSLSVIFFSPTFFPSYQTNPYGLIFIWAITLYTQNSEVQIHSLIVIYTNSEAFASFFPFFLFFKWQNEKGRGYRDLNLYFVPSTCALQCVAWPPDYHNNSSIPSFFHF
jgi:hypothetical protein